MGSYEGKRVNGWIPEGGLGFKGRDEEDGVGGERIVVTTTSVEVDEGLKCSAC